MTPEIKYTHRHLTGPLITHTCVNFTGFWFVAEISPTTSPIRASSCPRDMPAPCRLRTTMFHVNRLGILSRPMLWEGITQDILSATHSIITFHRHHDIHSFAGANCRDPGFVTRSQRFSSGRDDQRSTADHEPTDTVTYLCDFGLDDIMKRTTILRCPDSGQWDKAPPKCPRK
jgi:hypothetical protein